MNIPDSHVATGGRSVEELRLATIVAEQKYDVSRFIEDDPAEAAARRKRKEEVRKRVIQLETMDERHPVVAALKQAKLEMELKEELAMYELRATSLESELEAARKEIQEMKAQAELDAGEYGTLSRRHSTLRDCAHDIHRRLVTVAGSSALTIQRGDLKRAASELHGIMSTAKRVKSLPQASEEDPIPGWLNDDEEVVAGLELSEVKTLKDVVQGYETLHNAHEALESELRTLQTEKHEREKLILGVRSEVDCEEGVELESLNSMKKDLVRLRQMEKAHAELVAELGGPSGSEVQTLKSMKAESTGLRERHAELVAELGGPSGSEVQTLKSMKAESTGLRERHAELVAELGGPSGSEVQTLKSMKALEVEYEQVRKELGAPAGSELQTLRSMKALEVEYEQVRKELGAPAGSELQTLGSMKALEVEYEQVRKELGAPPGSELQTLGSMKALEVEYEQVRKELGAPAGSELQTLRGLKHDCYELKTAVGGTPGLSLQTLQNKLQALRAFKTEVGGVPGQELQTLRGLKSNLKELKKEVGGAPGQELQTLRGLQSNLQELKREIGGQEEDALETLQATLSDAERFQAEVSEIVNKAGGVEGSVLEMLERICNDYVTWRNMLNTEPGDEVRILDFWKRRSHELYFLKNEIFGTSHLGPHRSHAKEAVQTLRKDRELLLSLREALDCPAGVELASLENLRFSLSAIRGVIGGTNGSEIQTVERLQQDRRTLNALREEMDIEHGSELETLRTMAENQETLEEILEELGAGEASGMQALRDLKAEQTRQADLMKRLAKLCQTHLTGQVEQSGSNDPNSESAAGEADWDLVVRYVGVVLEKDLRSLELCKSQAEVGERYQKLLAGLSDKFDKMKGDRDWWRGKALKLIEKCEALKLVSADSDASIQALRGCVQELVGEDSDMIESLVKEFDRRMALGRLGE